MTAGIFACGVQAARDTAEPVPPPQAGGYEIVVMEVQGCRYCPLYRSDILPVYRATPRGRSVPLRFQDINAAGASDLKLKGSIRTVPTAVLVNGDSEVGRIEGYVGPEMFTAWVTSQMLGRQ